MANTEEDLGLPPPWPPASPMSGPGLLQERHKPPNSVFPTLSALLCFKAEATFSRQHPLSRQPPTLCMDWSPVSTAAPVDATADPRRLASKVTAQPMPPPFPQSPTQPPLSPNQGMGREQGPGPTSSILDASLTKSGTLKIRSQSSQAQWLRAEQGRGLPVTSAVASALGGGQTCAGQVGIQVM